MDYENDFPKFLTGAMDKLAPDRDAPWSLAKGPSYVGKAYQDIAENGVYGQGGIDSIMSKVRANRNFQRRALARSLRRRYGNRLGPRSGATEALASNITYGGAAGEDAGTMAQLEGQNMSSKTQGLQGLLGVVQLLQERYRYEQERKDNKPGVLDYFGAAGGIASSIGSLFSGNSGKKKFA